MRRSSLDRARVRPRRDYGGRTLIIIKIIKRFVKRLFIAGKYVINKRRFEIGDLPQNSLERKWEGLRQRGKDESAGPNLLAMIARTIGVSGRYRRVYLLSFFSSL